jgi:pyruvate,orthophosphate dikinase
MLAAHLEREGLVERRPSGRLGLTPNGRARGEELRAAERRALAPEAAAIDAPFARLNTRVKHAITAWQVRLQGSVDVPNDHDDPRHDATVLADLTAAVDEAVALLTPLAEGRPRYAAYRDRLGRAAKRVRGGEGRFVSGLDVDSVHTVWWQLHAEILALVGRPRGTDDA